MVRFGVVRYGSRGMSGFCGARFGKVWQAGTVLARLGAVGFGKAWLIYLKNTGDLYVRRCRDDTGRREVC